MKGLQEIKQANESLQVTDRESAAVARAPRVSLADIEAQIAEKHCFTLGEALAALGRDSHASLSIVTVCILVMRNGFVIQGLSAPASPENFNAVLGEKLAYENAIRQVWPLMGYALKEKLQGN